MAIEVTLEGRFEEENDFEGYMNFIQETAIKNQLKMEIYEDCAVIDVCPEGYIEISCENLYVSISAQTNVAGAGFHAFVCDFFAQIQKRSPIVLNANDPTGYYDQRNFNHLKYGIFHRWLADIVKYVKEEEDTVSELCISWPLDYYQPKHKQGYIVTPLGYINKQDFCHTDINELAERFFIWNQLGRTADYYRNAALNLLWKECYFEFSNMNEETKKQADTILDLLEIAYEKNPELPLPLMEYHLLCEIRKREKKLIDAQAMTNPIKIGYRYDNVEYHYGNWCITLEGFCEKNFDHINQLCYLMSPYRSEEEPWKWMIRMEAVNNLIDLNQQENDWKVIGKSMSWKQGDAFGIGVHISNEDHVLIEAYLAHHDEQLFVQAVVCDESDVEYLLKQIQSISYQNKEMPSLQA